MMQRTLGVIGTAILAALPWAAAPPAAAGWRRVPRPCSSPFARWVQELVARGITAGCGGSLYCPSDPVTRAQMAVFLTKTSPSTVPDP